MDDQMSDIVARTRTRAVLERCFECERQHGTLQYFGDNEVDPLAELAKLIGASDCGEISRTAYLENELPLYSEFVMRKEEQFYPDRKSFFRRAGHRLLMFYRENF